MTKEQAIEELKSLSPSQETIETVLSMLKEKDKEIEEYKRMIATRIINTAKDELVQEKNKEIEHKDKIIYEMAKAFRQDDVRSVEEIIKYFERKSEEC